MISLILPKHLSLQYVKFELMQYLITDFLNSMQYLNAKQKQGQCVLW